MFKLHIKHCFLSQFHTFFICFVFDWVVKASAVCFVDCLAHVPWWWRGVEDFTVCFIDCFAYVFWQQKGIGAKFSLTSSFMALLFYISSLVILTVLICITACVQCFFIFYCFAVQCCFTAVHCIVIICKCTSFTFTLLNSKGF